MQTPTIHLIDASTLEKVNWQRLERALQIFVDDFFAPVWRKPAHVKYSDSVPKGDWAILFVDNPDVADAMGYHDLTPDGFPMAKVFVRMANAAKEPISITASHELAEMLANPSINLLVEGPRATNYAYEVADAVQARTWKIDGFPMTDFVTPEWFEAFHPRGSQQFSHLKSIDAPFKIDRGGWMPVQRNGGWTSIFGSRAAKRRFEAGEHPRTRLIHGSTAGAAAALKRSRRAPRRAA